MSYKSREITFFLSQFESEDTASAKRLVDSLVFVSRAEMHRYYRNVIINYYNRVRERVAVFPVSKIFFKKEEKIARDGREKRVDYDSSFVIGRILKSIEQEIGVYKVINSPTLNNIVHDKIKHVIFFDDTIGSGKRILDFWTKFPEKTIKSLKSLASYKKIKITFCTYAADLKGISNIVNNSSLQALQFASCITSNKYMLEYDSEIFDLIYKYNKKIYNFKKAGFKNSYTPVVFEHGCPNNLPLFFYKNKGKEWAALFPDRAIPPALQSYFSRKNIQFDRICNLINDKGYPKVALSLYQDLGLNEVEKMYLVPVLSLKKIGFSSARIENLLLLDKQILHWCFCQLVVLGLLNKERFVISKRGIDFLNGYEKKVLQHIFETASKNKKAEVYLPQTFRGTSAFV